ncbi:MAG: triose-phosphate isomerase [Cyanobacteria bacterium SZAS LIN-3]|nr:triose-phosphate isomerase [Cyanobacteria bacterium SZAS LIN-3]
MRKTIIAGNWKMHKTVAEARELAQGLVNGVKAELGSAALPDIVLCPTFVCLPEVLTTVKGSSLAVGAQNMDYRDSGAFTGEIAPGMLTSIGVSHVIIGHSERRQYFGETNESVNAKTRAALKHGLIPIVCVGETLAEREENRTDDVIKQQIKAGLAEISVEDAAKLVIAYEPVWAIGTGKNCEVNEANRVCKMIRATINEIYGQAGGTVADGIPVLYGGSVKPSTIDEQMEQSDIDGALVGGAALKVEEFLPIIKGGAKRHQLSASRA